MALYLIYGMSEHHAQVQKLTELLVAEGFALNKFNLLL